MRSKDEAGIRSTTCRNEEGDHRRANTAGRNVLEHQRLNDLVATELDELTPR